MAQNSFLLNPLKVVLWHEKPTATYVFLGDIPKNVRKDISAKKIGQNAQRYYGELWRARLGHEKITEVIGGDELSLFEELLEEKPQENTTASELNYVDFPPIYPEDKLSEIKEKIQIATGIPIYAQHLFYINSSGLQTTYRHTIDGPLTVDIRKMSPLGVLGLPIDSFMVARRESLRTSALDTIRAADSEFDINHIIYCTDLRGYISRVVSQLREQIDDPHIINNVYYGFVVKYWPMLSREAFYTLIVKPSELSMLYPDLSPSTGLLSSRYRAEREIIQRKYAQSGVIEKWAETAIDVSVVQMTAFVSPLAKTMINIRNLFDKLRVSVVIPEIQAWIQVNGTSYILRKRHIKNGSDIGFPTRSVFREGVCLAISLRKRDQETFHQKLTHSTAENEQSRYLFLSIHPNATYYMKTLWNEEDHLELNETVEIIKKFVSPIVSGINTLGKRVFIQGTRLAEVSAETIRFDTLSICLFWKKTLNESLQKVLRGAWDQYLQARITAPRNVAQPDRYEFTFRKGMYDFDPMHVDRIMATTVLGAENQYAYLTNSVIKTKWDQNFDGRVVKMALRSSDVRFEVLNIRQNEFELFYGFIADYCYHVGNIELIRNNSVKISATSDQKLNRLKEQDPDLFNLKKHGTNRHYSVLCQRPRQPIAYSEEEMAKLPAKDAARLQRYYNFTFKRPAYYGCPDKRFPHLAFIVGVHPRSYCLPCCNKKANVSGRFRDQVKSKCLEDGSFEGKREQGSASHIMAYGKPLDAGRLSRTPPEMAKLLSSDEYFLLGVPQSYGQVKFAGILHACAFCLGKSVDKMLSEAEETIGSGASRLLGGRLQEYFGETSIFAALKAETISRELQKFSRLPELAIEIMFMAFGVVVYIAIDEFADGRTSFYFTPDQLEMLGAANYICVLKSVNRFYPFVQISRSKIPRGLFDKTPFIKSIQRMINYGLRNATPKMRRLDLAALREIIEPECVYINRQNYVYACKALGAYIAIDYSTPFGNIVKDYTIEISNGSILAAALAKISAKLPREYIPLVPTERIFSLGKMAGVMAGEMLHRCSDGFEDLPLRECGYDIDDVNRVILAKLAPAPDNTREISSALWRNYQYQLFIVQFMSYVDVERNTELRAEIFAKIAARDFSKELAILKEELTELLKNYPADLRLILSQLSTFFSSKRRKELLRGAIEESVYEFDRSTISRLVSLSDIARIEELRKIAKGFAVENSSFDPRGKEFPNVYLPCGESPADYCDGARLIVHNLDELINLLSADLADPLRRITISNMSWADTIIDPFLFTQNPTENIIVYKILR